MDTKIQQNYQKNITYIDKTIVVVFIHNVKILMIKKRNKLNEQQNSNNYIPFYYATI